MLPSAECNLSQCITGILLLIDVGIFHTEPERWIDMVSDGVRANFCSGTVNIHACMFVCVCDPTLQHHGYLSPAHLPEIHLHLFVLRYRHHRHHPAGQMSCPPQCGPDERTEEENAQ